MSLLVVALLSLLWLGFFLPSLLEARRPSSPYASATTFQESLRRLGEVPYPPPPSPTGPGGQPPPPRAALVQARRRETLAVLSAAVVAGALIAVGFGGWAVWAVAPPALSLVAYVALLRRKVRRRSALRRAARNPTSDSAAGARLAAPGSAAPASVETVAADPEIVPSVARRAGLQAPERMAG